mgnify:FL=1
MVMVLAGNGSITGVSSMPTNVQFGGTVGVTGAMNTSSTFSIAGALTPAAGIAFPATQVSSSNANTLDDYEEGTFTPSLITDSGTPSYNYRSGYYTKIGRQVFCGGIIGSSNSSSLTGNIRIGSLPFASGTLPDYGYACGIVADGSGFTWPVEIGRAHV